MFRVEGLGFRVEGSRLEKAESCKITGFTRTSQGVKRPASC